MDAEEKDYRLGPGALLGYPKDGGVERVRAWNTGQMSQGTKTFVAVTYVVLITLAVLWLLYAVIPYYQSPYYHKPYSAIEYANDWLWEFEAYSLYTPAWSTIITWTDLAHTCIGVPLFAGAVLELVYSWRRSSWYINTFKVVCLVLVAAVGLAPWDSADARKLSALLWD